MYEEIYELKLPPWEEIRLTSFTIDDDNLKYNYLQFSNLKDIIKPKYLELIGLNWTQLLYFKKENIKGKPHIDTPSFGINWVTDGDSSMEFYELYQVKEDNYTSGPLNRPDWGNAKKFIPLTYPYKTYTMKQGKAYLVHTSAIHCATGIGPRKVFSLRTGETDIEWVDVIQRFQELILA